MKRARALTVVQKRVAEVRAARVSLLERSAARDASDDEKREVVLERRLTSEERPLLRGEIEPEIVVAEDGTVRLAPFEWSTEASDASEQ